MRLEFEPNVATIPLVESGSFEDIPVSPDLETLLKKGIDAAQSGDRDRARDALLKATCLDQNCEDAWMWLASISEYPEELLAFLDHVLRINLDNQRAVEWRLATRSLLAKTFVQRAVRAHEQNDEALCEHNLEQAFQFDENCVSAWQAKAAWAPGPDEKQRILNHILVIDPENAAAHSAIDELNHSKIDGLMEAAKTAAAAGKRKKAVELLDQLLDAAPEMVSAWILRSHFSLTLDEKLHDLERALELEPDNVVARANYDFLAASSPAPAKEAEEPQPEEVHSEVEAAAEPVISAEPEFAAQQEFSSEPGFSAEPEVTEEEEYIAAQPTDESIELPEDIHQEVQAESFEQPVEDANFDTTQPLNVAEVFELDVHDSVAANVEDYPSPFEEEASSFVDHEPAQEVAFHNAITEVPLADAPADEVEVVPDTLVSLSPFDEVAEPETPSAEDLFLSAAEHAQDNGHVAPSNNGHSQTVLSVVCCPFCQQGNDSQAFACGSCRASLSVSDIDSLIANSNANREVIQHAVTQMEAEWNLRDFTVDELVHLALGHFNLRNFDAGLSYLQEAARHDPNNVILSGQANAIAIRLQDLRRQQEVHDSMPQGKTILVVDDSATIRKLISAKLEKCGHNVVCAADGVEAMEMMANLHPDLVLLDITMPRMDGYEVCKQIRANPAGKDLPVVMISGKDGFFDKVRGRMAGSTGYVTKPFGPETLMKALETYLLREEPALVQ